MRTWVPSSTGSLDDGSPPYVVGNHPCRQSVTDFRRWRQTGGRTFPLRPAARVRARIRRWSRSTGPGHRVARLAARVRRHRADHEEVGRRLTPGAAFHDLDEIAAAPESTARTRLPCSSPAPRRAEARARVRSRQTQARWLVPGRRDGGPSHDRATEWPGKTGSTAPADFRELYGPLFTAEPVAVFTSGFLMRKRDTNEGRGPVCRLPAAPDSHSPGRRVLREGG
jgi:hypothetical protein